MSEQVQIPIDITNWEKFVGVITAANKASKEMGESFKKAIPTETITGGLHQVSSALKSVDNDSVKVAGHVAEVSATLVQSFAQGGPFGLAIGVLTVGVQKIFEAIDYGDEVLKKGEAFMQRQAEERGAAIRAANRAAEAQAASVSEALQKGNEIAEQAAEQRAKERNERRKKAAQERFDFEIQLANEAADADLARMQAQNGIERETEERARRESLARTLLDIDKKADAAKRLADARILALDRVEQRERFLASATERTDRIFEEMVGNAEEQAVAVASQISGTAANAANAFIGPAIQAFTLYSKAAEAASGAAKMSAEERAANEAAATQAVLASLAQQAGTQAVFETAQGIADLALGFTGEANRFGSAAAHFTAAGVFGTIAGGTAIAANQIGQTRGATTQERQSSGGDSAGPARTGGTDGGRSSDTSSGGGVTINIVGGRAYATGAEVGAQTAKALRDFKRYGGRS